MDINEYNRLMGIDTSGKPNRNTGLGGDVVDLAQRGALQGVAGVADFVGLDDAAGSLREQADAQSDTITLKTQRSMEKPIFEDDPDSRLGIKTGEGLYDPRTIIGTLAETAGQAAPSLVGGGAVGLGARALGAAAGTASTVGSGLIGGAQEGGQQGQQAYEQVKQMDFDTLSQSNLFAERVKAIKEEFPSMKSGAILDQARSEVADEIKSQITYDPSMFAVNAAMDAIGDAAVFNSVLRRGSDTVGGGMVQGAVTEGTTEAIQGGYGQYVQNVGMQQADPTIDPMEGVASGAATEALFGGGIGAVTGGIGGAISTGQPEVVNQPEESKGDVNATQSVDLTQQPDPQVTQEVIQSLDPNQGMALDATEQGANIPQQGEPVPLELQPFSNVPTQPIEPRTSFPDTAQQEYARIQQEDAQAAMQEQYGIGEQPQGITDVIQPEQATQNVASPVEPVEQPEGITDVLPEEVAEEPAPKPKKATPAQKRVNRAIAMNIPQKLKDEKAKDQEARIAQAEKHFTDIGKQVEDGSIATMPREDLERVSKDLGLKVRKKDSNATLRTNLENWQKGVAGKAERRDAVRSGVDEISTLEQNQEDIPMSMIEQFEKDYTEATRTRAKNQQQFETSSIYTEGDVEIAKALGLDSVPSPTSENRTQEFETMREFIESEDMGEYMEGKGLLDEAAQYVITTEDNINDSFGNDRSLTKALGLPEGRGVPRTVNLTLAANKKQILDRLPEERVKQLREAKEAARAKSKERTKQSVAAIGRNRQRQNEIMDSTTDMDLGDALDAVGEFDPESTNAISRLVKDGMTEEAAKERTKRITQRGMIDSIVADKVGLDESEALKRQWDTNDFSRDPIEQAKEFLTGQIPELEAETQRLRDEISESEAEIQQITEQEEPESITPVVQDRDYLAEAREEAEADSSFQNMTEVARDSFVLRQAIATGLNEARENAEDGDTLVLPQQIKDLMKQQLRQDFTARPRAKFLQGAYDSILEDFDSSEFDPKIVTSEYIDRISFDIAGRNFKGHLNRSSFSATHYSFGQHQTNDFPTTFKRLVQDVSATPLDQGTTRVIPDDSPAPNTQIQADIDPQDLQQAASQLVEDYRLAERNMNPYKPRDWLGHLQSNVDRYVEERGGEVNYSQADLARELGITPNTDGKKLAHVIESEGTQGDIEIARKLFPETAAKRDAGEPIQLLPYFPQYMPKSQNPDTPEIGDHFQVFRVEPQKSAKRKITTADFFYVEEAPEGDRVKAVTRTDRHEVTFFKKSDGIWSAGKGKTAKATATLEKANLDRETTRDDLRRRWIAENPPEGSTDVIQGNEATVYTADGTEVPVRYQVVEADSIQTSHNTDFTSNAAFPEELQPRDRSGAALQQQVRSIASDIQPERLGESSEVDRGAPIVRDGNVESGNGRTMAIKMAYQKGNAGRYRRWLEQNGDRFGVNVEGMEQPILVRERLGDMPSREFVVAANEQATAELSTLEQAQIDASRLTDDDLAQINIPDTGDMLSPSNAKFMLTFMMRLGGASVSGLTTADGSFNKQAGTRALNAVFHKAYGNDALTQLVAEESNPDIKNILNALTRASASMARLHSYDLGDVGFGEKLAQATMIVRASRASGQSIQEMVSQNDLLEVRDPIADELAVFMDKNIRSAKRMAEVIKSMAQQIETSHQNSQTGDLFGDSQQISITGVLQSNEVYRDSLQEQIPTQGQLLDNPQSVQRSSEQRDQQSESQEDGQRAEAQEVSNTDVLQDADLDRIEKLQRELAGNRGTMARQIRDHVQRIRLGVMEGKPLDQAIEDVRESDTLAAEEVDELLGNTDVVQQPTSRLDQAQSKLSQAKKDAFAELKAKMDARKGTLHSGVDPEIVAAVIKVGALYVADGTVQFAQWARDVVSGANEMGIETGEIEPYLKEAYGGMMTNPSKYGISDDVADMMDTPREVRNADLNEILSPTVDNLEDTQNVPDPFGDTESDSADTSESVREQPQPEPVQTEPATAERGARETSRAATSDRVGRTGGTSVSEVSSRTDGAERDSGVHNPDGSTGVARGVTGLDQSRTDSRTDGQRDVVKSEGEAATSSATESGVPPREERVRLQKEAESLESKTGNLANIRATLPILLPEQQEDVHFAEKRLYEAGGKGVHFANGTGTGKTFSGLGVAKRMQREGKDNILIVTPSNEINKEWFNAAPLFQMDINQLESKEDAGSGVTITTYANFRDNWQLGTRDWDAIIMDESHNLLQKDSTDATTALTTLRALTGHPRGVSRLNKLMHPEVGRPHDELSSRYNKLQAERDGIEGTGRPRTLVGAEKARVEEIKVLQMRIKEKLDPLSKELARTYEAAREEAEKRWNGGLTKTVMLSATPWSYRKSVSLSEGYLYDYPEVELSGAYNSANAEQQFFIDTFGYQMKNNKLNEPDAKVDTGLLEREFNEKLKEIGSLRARVLEVEYDYDRKFELVDGGIGSRIDEGMAYLREKRTEVRKAAEAISDRESDEYKAARQRFDGWETLYNQLVSDFDYQQQIYLLEAIKAKAAVPYIREHLAKGRKVVVFHGFNKGLEPNTTDGSNHYRPFHINIGELAANNLKAAWAEFEADRPDLTSLAIEDLTKPIDTFAREFPDQAVFVNGLVSKKVAQKGITDFNKDGSGKDIIVVQQDKGSAGISLHDKTGEHQRVLINLGIPVKPTQSIQIEGRIYRVNLKSDALFRYFNTGLNFERRMFASRMATRAGTTENLAMGNTARALKDNLVDAFENSQAWGVGFEGEGIGGKELDRASNTHVTQWDKAKSYYYTQQKKTSRTKAQEGQDYFATPEPVGLKMVEWAGLQKGDKVLEPSAGHGAISRWFPDGVNGHIVEPSTALFPRAQMATNSLEKAHNIEFEEFGTNNKFNAVVMNPPYGRGGKTAMEHVGKAFEHLRRGGRVLAIVPDGPAFNKRLDEWLSQQTEANHVATVKLPDATFKRAGTSVRTKVIAIDRIPKGIPREQSHHEIDLSDETDIDGLFERLEDMSLPPRQEIQDIDVDEVLTDAGIEVKKRRKSKTKDAGWLVSGRGTYRYKEGIKQASATETPPYWERSTSSWVFPENNGNPSEAIAENVLKVDKGELKRSYSNTDVIPERGISMKAAEVGVNQFLKKYRGAADVKVKVVPTQNEIGEIPTREEQVVQAVYDHASGEVTLIAENIQGKNELLRVLRHEVFAHHGLERLMSRDDYKAFMDSVISSDSPYLRRMWQRVNDEYPDATIEQRAEEVVARIAEDDPDGITRVIQKVISTLQRWLRKVGLLNGNLTTQDVRNVLDGIVEGFINQSPTFKPATARRSFSTNKATSAELRAKFAPESDTVSIRDRASYFVDAVSQGQLGGIASQWWGRVVPKLRQRGVDRFDALKRLDASLSDDGEFITDSTNSSYILAHMAEAASGALSVMMEYGRIKFDPVNKVIVPQSDKPTGGFTAMLDKLGDENEISDFMMWIAGNRAQTLNRKADAAAKKASEINSEITRLKDMVYSQQWDKGSPELTSIEREIKKLNKELNTQKKKATARDLFLEQRDIDGMVDLINQNDADGNPRKEKFEKVFKEFEEYRSDVLGVAEATGLINAETRAIWENEFYVPFYRVMEEENQNGAPQRSAGIDRQEASKRFKGSDRKIGDLLDNTVRNFEHLLTASLKNQAAVQAMENGIETGLVTKTTEHKRRKTQSTWVMVDGKKVWYNVEDALLFDAISALSAPMINNPFFNAASKFKRLFTNIVTSSPGFIITNYIRDTIQTQAFEKNDLRENIRSAMKGAKIDHAKAMMMTTGASFSFKQGNNYSELTGGTDNRYGAITAKTKGRINDAWEWYQDAATGIENANRAAVFAANIEHTNVLEAAYRARDLMNFSSHGSSPTVRVLISIVPFLNARIQGLDKLSRQTHLWKVLKTKTANASEKEMTKRFWMIAGGLMMASVALHLVNRTENEEEYMKLHPEERDMYWHIGGFRIPKPFELGVFASAAERAVDYMILDKAQDGDAMSFMARTALNTFGFNPTPQIIKPLVEVYFNYNMFTGREIESVFEQGTSAEYIYDYRTTELAKILGEANANTLAHFGIELSPKQIDHLMYGYTGWVGSVFNDTFNSLVNAFKDNPAPAKPMSDLAIVKNSIGRLYRDTDQPRYTAVQARLYDAYKETDRYYKDLMKLNRIGDVEGARDLIISKGEKIQLRQILSRTQGKISQINRVKEAIRNNPNLTPAEKRERIEMLQSQQTALSTAIMSRLEQFGL